MGGLSDIEILEERERVKRKLEEFLDEPFEIIDSCFYEKYQDPLYCLGESIKLISDADTVFFAKDWAKSRGCQIEYMCARQYGYQIVEEGLDDK